MLSVAVPLACALPVHRWQPLCLTCFFDGRTDGGSKCSRSWLATERGGEGEGEDEERERLWLGEGGAE